MCVHVYVNPVRDFPKGRKWCHPQSATLYFIRAAIQSSEYTLLIEYVTLFTIIIVLHTDCMTDYIINMTHEMHSLGFRYFYITTAADWSNLEQNFVKIP